MKNNFQVEDVVFRCTWGITPSKKTTIKKLTSKRGKTDCGLVFRVSDGMIIGDAYHYIKPYSSELEAEYLYIKEEEKIQKKLSSQKRILHGLVNKIQRGYYVDLDADEIELIINTIEKIYENKTI